MNPEALLVTVYFLMPGLIAVVVFEWWVAARDRPALELTAIALALSLLAAAPLAALPQARSLVGYLWEPSSLAPQSLVGVGLQSFVAITMASTAGAYARKKGRWGAKSFFQRSTDWLWSQHAQEHRYIVVRTEDDLYYGELAFADDPAVGRDLILRNPGTWDEARGDFHRSGMKYVLIPGHLMRHVEVSVADPVSDSDYPFYEAGHVAGAQPITKGSENNVRKERLAKQ